MEPVFIDMASAVDLHEEAMKRYGGLAGLRDPGGLDSAIGQAESSYGGIYLHPTIFDQAAAYLYHIAKNHPFLDGNKRTAAACAVVFLAMNGYRLPKEADAALESITWRVAQGEVEKSELADFFRSQVCVSDPQ